MEAEHHLQEMIMNPPPPLTNLWRICCKINDDILYTTHGQALIKNMLGTALIMVKQYWRTVVLFFFNQKNLTILTQLLLTNLFEDRILCLDIRPPNIDFDFCKIYSLKV